MTTLSQSQLESLWIQAGGDPSLAPTMAAITVPESGSNPSSVQQGVPYSQQGWGLWQITPGNSEPQFGVNQALLNPLNNARAAVAKEQSQGLGAWTTYTSKKYVPYLHGGLPASGGSATSASSGSSKPNASSFLQSLDAALNPKTSAWDLAPWNWGNDTTKLAMMLVVRGGITILGLSMFIAGMGLLGFGALESAEKVPAIKQGTAAATKVAEMAA